jgi:hypothetical protein
VIARQADRAVGEQGKEPSEWRGRLIGKWWRLEASVWVGFGEEKNRTFGFQQGAEGTNPRGGALTLIADVGMGTNSHGHRQAGNLSESFT